MRLPRSRGARLLTGILVAAAAIVAVVLLTREPEPLGHTRRPGDVSSKDAVVERVGVGQVVAADTGVQFRNGADRPVTIDAISLQDADGGIELVGLAMERRDADGTQRRLALPATPRGDDPTPAQSFPAGAEGDVTLRVRATKPGRWVARGVRVDYRDGDRLLSAYFPRALILCAPADASVACDPDPLATDVVR